MTYNTHDTIYYKSAKKLLGYGRKILSAGKCLKYPIESLAKLPLKIRQYRQAIRNMFL